MGKIHCPECIAMLVEENFEVKIYGDEILVEITCPRCAHKIYIGLNQSNLED